jgi:tRNA(Ile)-lysidine synthase
LSKISFPLVVRTRNPGDIIQPFGMKGKMKLKKYFVSKNIPRFKRDVIPLLVSNKEVLWAVGVGISEKLRVFEAPTHIIEIK